MDEWTQYLNQAIAVVIQIGAVVATLGLSWNLKDIIIGATVAGGSGQVFAAIVFRVIGIVLALVLLISAPSIVNTFQSGFRTPLFQP